MFERPLKILVGADVEPDPNSGAAGTVVQMNRALRRLGHQVDEIWSSDLGRRIRHGNLHYLLELPRAYRTAVRSRCRGGDYDVIELNQPHAYLAAQDHRRTQRRGILVNRSHGHEVRADEASQRWGFANHRKAPCRRALSNLLRDRLQRHWLHIAESADGFVVSCAEDRNFLCDRYGVDHRRVAVIAQGLPEPFLAMPPAGCSTDRSRRLLYVGQFTPCKAPEIVAQAATALLAQRQDAVMTWVCSDSHHSTIAQLLAPEIRDRVLLRAWMPQIELLELFDQHGIFLFPSYFEGFGKAPLEAMSRGMCVIASDTGGMRDFIDDGVSGLLVPPGRPDLVADRARRLWQDEDSLRRMSLAARAAAGRYSWDACAQETVGFYRSLLGGKSPAAARLRA